MNESGEKKSALNEGQSGRHNHPKIHLSELASSPEVPPWKNQKIQANQSGSNWIKVNQSESNPGGGRDCQTNAFTVTHQHLN